LSYRRKEEYVVNQGLELDPQLFYTLYGYKTREFAEQEFSKTVKSVYDGLEEGELKSFLNEEYISTDFKVNSL
jgi:hypothetical protein